MVFSTLSRSHDLHTQAYILGVTDIAIALLAAIAAIPLIKRKVPMNHLYGIRIPAAFKSQAHWYTINAYGGKQLLYWSIPALCIGLAFCLLPALSQPQWLSLAALGLASPAVSLFFVFRFSRKLPADFDRD